MLDNDLVAHVENKRPLSASRRMLQLCVAIGAMVPVSAGIWGALAGLGGGEFVSHQRYLSGLLLMIGIVFWSTIPGIERKTVIFRLLTLLVLGGGLCRLVGVALGDPLGAPVASALIMELGVTPLLCLWQGSLAARYDVVVLPNSPIVGVTRGWFLRLRRALLEFTA
jgi:uncharacterized protein DUF4345